MRDIVEELREYAVGSSLPVEQDLIKKAVDEIETLRRDVRTAVMGDSAELQDVKRENEKLLEALSEAEGHLEYAYIITFRDRLRDAAIAARSALAAIRESGDD